jgi:hypothetical protein
MKIVARAYQLARSGECRGLREIIDQLRLEGATNPSIDDRLRGSVIQADLARLCHEARGTSPRYSAE